MHSYLGSTLIVIPIVFIIGPTLRRWMIKEFGRFKTREKHSNRDLSFFAKLISIVLGAYSHIILDSIMHSDIRPFQPFSDVNGLFQIISYNQLISFCLISGGVGLFLLFLYKLINRLQTSE